MSGATAMRYQHFVSNLLPWYSARFNLWLATNGEQAPKSAALAQLSQRQREVVVLVDAFEWTQREVSDLLGIRLSSVQTHLTRGLTRLRVSLGVSGDE